MLTFYLFSFQFNLNDKYQDVVVVSVLYKKIVLQVFVNIRFAMLLPKR